jgi:outer membrane protein OmpA-like peptidoglycan-associated protein
MRLDATLNVTVEGYTDNIGTEAYNMALGNRRAAVVRDYLVGHGVATDRIQTVSFGEGHAKFGNGREETRQMNRRAAVVVTLLQRR